MQASSYIQCLKFMIECGIYKRESITFSFIFPRCDSQSFSQKKSHKRWNQELATSLL